MNKLTRQQPGVTVHDKIAALGRQPTLKIKMSQDMFQPKQNNFQDSGTSNPPQQSGIAAVGATLSYSD